MATLHIRLLGEFAAYHDQAPLTGINSQRLQSLLACLLLHRDAPLGRQWLAFTFWPDSDEGQARSNLRNLLHTLIEALPDGKRFIQADNQTVQWRPDAPFTLDMDELLTALAEAQSAADLQRALELHRGPLLPSCYDDWIAPERERLEERVADAVQGFIDRWEREGAYRDAIAFAHQILRGDPLREDLYQQLMRLYAACGDRAGVARTYKACCAALARELEVEPSPQTQEIYKRCLRTEPSGPSAPDPPALPAPAAPPPRAPTPTGHNGTKGATKAPSSPEIPCQEQSQPQAAVEMLRARKRSLKTLTKLLSGLVAAFAVLAVIWRFLVAPQPVKISILTTDTKAEWLGAVTKDFNDAHRTTAAGRPIEAEILQVSGPDEMMQSVREGSKLKPVLWSPGDASWIQQANELRKQLGQPAIVKDECPSIVYVPTGFAIWRPMAEALGWPDKPISWKQILDLADDPQGWDKYGLPQWGQFKFGHTHPEQSTTGFNMLASLAYAAAGKTRDLTPQDVKSDAVKNAFRMLERDTYRYGLSTKNLLNLAAQHGPGYLHAASSSETSFIKTQQVLKSQMRYPWAFIFPAEGVFWSDNPTCILQASWVSPEQSEAAKIYRDFLLAPPQQDKAVEIGLRPATPGVALHCPICLENGTDPRVTPQSVPPLAGVSGDTNAAIIDVFKETKKKATVAALLDMSQSMEGDKLTNAIAGSRAFLGRLDRDDEIYAYTFNDAVTPLQPSGRVGDVSESLSKVLGSLFVEGNTALYDGVCTAMDAMAKAKEEDLKAGEARLYGIVLLSDGKDTNSKSKRTENDMFACLPPCEDVKCVRIYTIAYGDDADKDLLTRIANRTNGEMFTATPENIKQIYLQISAEQ